MSIREMSMMRTNRLILLPLMLLVLWLLPLRVWAQDAGFVIRAEADSSTCRVGDTVEIRLWLERIDAAQPYQLYNFEDWLIYDGRALQFIGCNALAGDFRLADGLAYNEAYDRLTLRYQQAAAATAAPLAQPKLEVARLAFRAVAAGDTTLYQDAAAVWLSADGAGAVSVSAPHTLLSITSSGQQSGGGGGAAGGGGGGSAAVSRPVLGGDEVAAAAECLSAGFADLAADAWYHQAVDYMLAGGLMNGVSADSFAPGMGLDRGMLVTILWRAAGEPVAAAAPFADVPGTLYSAGAIGWAYAGGAVRGIDEDTFAPGMLVLREQLAAILWRLQGEPPASRDLAAFCDAGTASPYAAGALGWAAANGLLLGDDQGRLRPRDGITRAEAAAVLMRYLELVKHNEAGTVQ